MLTGLCNNIGHLFGSSFDDIVRKAIHQMANDIQVFQSRSKWRWKTFQWVTRLILFFLLLMIPIVWIALERGYKPNLPELSNPEDAATHLSNPTIPKSLTLKEKKKYQGYTDFLTAKSEINRLISRKNKATDQRIRAAFYVDWDPQSFSSLQKNIDKLNMVVPEWFFIDPKTDTLLPKIDSSALQVMKEHRVKILPIINNINQDLGAGEFDGKLISRIIHNKGKREKLIASIIYYLKLYQLQGINVDFEDFTEKSDEPIIGFQKEIYTALHKNGFLVTQDIMPDNSDFNTRELASYNDYMFLMAYDEHYSTSSPGSVCSQKWIEKMLDETASEIPSNKIILCIAGYGYDWPENQSATTVTYQEALAFAKENHATIDFDSATYTNQYEYKLGGVKHYVSFTDAVSNFNAIRFADEYGTSGTALWRLGSEDERLWMFYHRDLSNNSLKLHPFDYSKLTVVNTPTERPDYIGDGEILNVASEPEQGKIDIEYDSSENLINDQVYRQLPTKYVIRRFGNVKKQVILTFDDGPDPEYTPQILDILKREKVPATFFVVGMEAENNLPLLKRIYAEGHEIGNHTFTHPNIAEVSTERAVTEMEATRLLIESVLGKSTILFRAPYNADAEPTKEVELKPIALSRINNYYTVGESIDPNDWEEGVSADSIYVRTIRQYEANPSKGIILFHDAGGNRQATVDALPRIIQYFKKNGIQFITVAKLLGKTEDGVMPPVKGKLVKLNKAVVTFGYWAEHILYAAFWVAIFLGLARIVWMAVMAGMQKWRKRHQVSAIPKVLPPVSIIVPAYNEEVNARNTIDNLLLQDYPVFEIIFVDDGSRDNTYKIIYDAFAGNSRVKVITKPNGGKASALNFGISQSSYEFLVCIDADTQLKPDAVRQLMFAMLEETKMGDPIIAAVAGNVKVGNENTILTKWQSIEYTTAQNFDRRAFDLVNAITVVPGAIGAFRKKAVEEAGAFTTDTLAEDCDLTMRILRNGYRVVNCTSAIAVTEAPETLKQFMKQRFRWSYGIMQSFWKNRDAMFNPKYKSLGMTALPNILLFQILLPMLAPLADIMLVVSLFWNRTNPESMQKIGLYYLVFLAVDILVSVVAFAFEGERFSKLIWIIPQRFVYRQLMYVILFKSLRNEIKGEGQGWGVLKRTGNVRAQFEDMKV